MSVGTPPFRSRFLLLWSAGVTSVVLVLPYAFSLQRDALAAVTAKPVSVFVPRIYPSMISGDLRGLPAQFLLI